MFYLSKMIDDLFVDYKIMLLHNERIVEKQPACGETLCTVEQYKEAYKGWSEIDFTDECTVD